MSKEKNQERIRKSLYGEQIKGAGMRLYELREKRGLSQRHFVEQLSSERKEGAFANISKTHYARLENGDCIMNIDILIALCKFYGVTADYILYGEKNTDNDIATFFSRDTAISTCESLEFLAKKIRSHFD
jgi:transcriptional regulator with XRE-family HTH domain